MKLLKYIFFTAAILMSSLALYAGETVKYVFLFIGDGMSIPQRMTAEEFSRINTGKGLAMNSMPHQALTITRSKNSFITDSAASGTAIACGVKTKNGAIGVGAGFRKKSRDSHERHLKPCDSRIFLRTQSKPRKLLRIGA